MFYTPNQKLIYFFLKRTAGLLLVVLFFCVVAIFSSKSANADFNSWYDQNWTKRIMITVDQSEVNSSLNNFPVYIDLSTLGSDFFAYVQDDGDDIRITTEDGSGELPFDLVSISTSTDTGEIYFKAELSSLTDNKFYIYFDNATATSYAASSTYGRNAVWSNYEAVYHLKDLSDSTGNGHTLTAVGSPTSLGGKIGKGYSYPGSTSVYHKTSSSVIDMNSSSDGRLSAWVKPSNDTRGDFAGQWPAYLLKWSLSGNTSKFRMHSNYATNSFAQSPSTYTTDVWKYVVGNLDFSSKETALYVDGSLVATSTGSGNIAIENHPFSIGAEYANLPYNPFSGVVDEVRLSTQVLGSDWEDTEYANQSDPSSFYSIGSIESWYDQNWKKRIPVDINQTEINSSLNNFPVYIDLSTLGSDFFNYVKGNGADIRVTTEDGITELATDLVSISTSTNNGEMYFKANTISSTNDTRFYIYFDNATATSYAASSTYGRNAVWSNYKAVYHLENLTDSTGNGHSLTAVGSPTSLTGKLGSSYSYPGSVNDYHKTTNHIIDMNSSSDGRLSVWVKPSNSTRGDFAGQWPAYLSKWSLSGNDSKFMMHANYATNSSAVSSSTYSTSVWSYVVGNLDFSSKETSLYVNGVLSGTSIGSGNIAIENHPFSIGAEYANLPYNPFSGVVDEVRLSDSMLNSDWESSEYINQSDPNSFYSIGTIEVID